MKKKMIYKGDIQIPFRRTKMENNHDIRVLRERFYVIVCVEEYLYKEKYYGKLIHGRSKKKQYFNLRETSYDFKKKNVMS